MLYFFFLNSAKLICRGTDISKYFSGSLALRDNESRLYMVTAGSVVVCLIFPCGVLAGYDLWLWFLNIFYTSLFKYSRLSLCRIPRYSLKHFKISVPRHIRVERVRKTINRTTTFNKWICNLTPEGRNIYKIMWKKGEIAPVTCS